MTLYFDLTAFADTTDSELLKRVDRRVASYYLAVPLAGEDNRVTVATAYPDNAAALGVLRRLLRADVVPVSSPEAELHEAIARIYPAADPAQGAVVCWADDPAWYDAVTATANAFGQAAGRPVIILHHSETADDVLRRAAYDFSLLVTHVSDPDSLERLVRRSPVSLLLVRGAYRHIDQVLVALRGFGSDHETLDRVLPILSREGSGATVLPLSRSGAARLNDLLADRSPARQHLQRFLSDLDRKNVRVDIRLSQGDPADQIMNELAEGGHGMLVIAAEAEGEFVLRVLARIEQSGCWPDRPVLLVKPPVRPEGFAESCLVPGT